jgi:hypothetical protein
MIAMKTLFTIFFLSISKFLVIGQVKLPALENYFNEARLGKYQPIPIETIEKSPLLVLEGLAPYTKDTTALIRSKAYLLIQQVGIHSKDVGIRQHSVEQLIAAGIDIDHSNVGNVLTLLTTFSRDDFSDKAKDSFRALMVSESTHISRIFELAAFLELQDQIEFIRPYMEPGTAKEIRWSATISLARLNDLIATEDIMSRVKKMKINDNVIDGVFPDLAYTRHKTVIDYLVVALKSDEKNCTSSGESATPIPCGYRIMEQLAKAVKDYPLELDASGDIKTNDYKQALVTVRKWFDAHPNYEINRDTF